SSRGPRKASQSRTRPGNDDPRAGIGTWAISVCIGPFGTACGYHGPMPGEPKTGRGRASRERIVERAAGLFAERGIAATSLGEVLAAAKTGQGQFYHSFRGRDELAAAAVGHRRAQVVAGLTQALGAVSSLAGLEQALAGYVAGFEQAGLPGCPIGTLATEVAGRNEDARLQAAA